jgi:hypothetical protein
VLSPFVRKVKLTDATIDAELDELEEEDDIPVHDDDEDAADDGDEVAPEVEASDAQAVEDIMLEAELDGRVSPLGAGDAGCGCVMLSKVRGLLSDPRARN